GTLTINSGIGLNNGASLVVDSTKTFNGGVLQIGQGNASLTSVVESGNINIQGATAATGLQVGYSSAGAFTLEGNGTLNVNNGNEIVGYFGAGTFFQSGGTNSTSWELGVGVSTSGIYTLSGGTLNASAPSFALAIGLGGAGTFNQSGGVNNIGTGQFLIG